MKSKHHQKRSRGKEVHFVSERIPFKMQMQRLWEKKWFKFGLPSLALVALLICLISFLPNKEKTTLPKRYVPKSEEVSSKSQSSSSQPQRGRSKKNPKKIKRYEPGTREADVDYLKMHDRWKREDLHYPVFQTLYDSIFDGNISYIVRTNDTLFSDREPVNSFWRAMVNNLIRINSINDPNLTNQAQNEMRQLCNKYKSIPLDFINTKLKTLLNEVMPDDEDYYEDYGD